MPRLLRCVIGMALVTALIGCRPTEEMVTQVARFTPRPTDTLTATASNTPTFTPSLTATPTQTRTPTLTFTPSLTATPRPTRTPTLIPTITPTPFPPPSITWGRGVPPDGAIARLGIGAIFSVSLSPDEEFFAVGTSTGVYVYRVSTFEQVWAGATEWVVSSVEWGHDGTFLLTNGYRLFEWDNIFSVWAWQDGRGELLPGGLDAIPHNDEAGMPSRTYYVGEIYDEASGEPLNAVMDLGTGEVAFVLNPEPDLEYRARLEHFRFSPGCWMLAAYTGVPEDTDAPATDHRVYVWDVNTGEQLYVLDEHPEDYAVNGVSWSPDSSRLVSGAEDWEGHGEVIVWDMETGQPIREPQNLGYPVEVVKWSPDGDIIVAGGGDYWHDGRMTVLDASTGAPLVTWSGHPAPIEELIWVSGGRFLIAVSREGVVLWDMEALSPVYLLRGYFDQYAPETSFSPDGGTAAVAYRNGVVALWDVQMGEYLGQTMEENPEWRNYGFWVVWDENDNEFFYRQEGEFNLTRVGNSFDLIGEHEADMIIPRWLSPDTTLFASAGGLMSGMGDPLIRGWEENAVIVWDVATGQPIYRFLGHTGQVETLSWSSDGRVLASGSWDGTVILWEVAPPP